MSDAPLVAGVELGGTKCVCLLAAGPNDIRGEIRVPTRGPTETLAAIAGSKAPLPGVGAGMGGTARGMAGHSGAIRLAAALAQAHRLGRGPQLAGFHRGLPAVVRAHDRVGEPAVEVHPRAG